MADTTSKDESSKHTPAAVPDTSEDAETRATRRELKQSSISEAARPNTPPPASDYSNKEQILSPKKKRAHDQLDEDKAVDEGDAHSTASAESGKPREKGEEPEKKRVRDGDSTQDNLTTKEAETATKPIESKDKPQPQTSSSAFAASGFGKVASASSGFGALGASGGSAFGSGPAKLTSFASPSKTSEDAPQTATPKLSFGGGSNAASPFAKIGSPSNGFSSTLGGGGFGSVGTGARLGSFAAPAAKPLEGAKPAKPFGAPDSDAESDDSGDEEDNKAEDKESQGEGERAGSPVKEGDDKKKPKLQKVEIETGEAGEATVVSVRAKVFHLDNSGKDKGVEPTWKERGSGMLKINVPRACVEFDEDTGLPIPGSFDASGLEMDDEEVGEDAKGHRVVRLILRQDHTHRVILNTAVNASTKFMEKQTLKSAVIQFMAFEGGVTTPVNFTLRMTTANSKAFMDEMNVVQRSLRDI